MVRKHKLILEIYFMKKYLKSMLIQNDLIEINLKIVIRIRKYFMKKIMLILFMKFLIMMMIIIHLYNQFHNK